MTSGAGNKPPSDELVRDRSFQILKRKRKDHILLWEIVAEMSAQNGRSVEANWLHLMKEFWKGTFAPNGLTQFARPNPGSEVKGLDVYEELTRYDLMQVFETPSGLGAFALMKCQQQQFLEKGRDDFIELLLELNFEDYRAKVKPMYRWYFDRDDELLCGLSITLTEYEVWKSAKSNVLAEQVGANKNRSSRRMSQAKFNDVYLKHARSLSRTDELPTRETDREWKRAKYSDRVTDDMLWAARKAAKEAGLKARPDGRPSTHQQTKSRTQN